MRYNASPQLRVLDECPASAYELPRWFATLTDRDFDAVWVSAVTSFLVDDAPYVAVKPIAQALVYVRERNRGLVRKASRQ